MDADERALRREPRADVRRRQFAFDPVAQAGGVPARRVPTERPDEDLAHLGNALCLG